MKLIASTAAIAALLLIPRIVHAQTCPSGEVTCTAPQVGCCCEPGELCGYSVGNPQPSENMTSMTEELDSLVCEQYGGLGGICKIAPGANNFASPGAFPNRVVFEGVAYQSAWQVSVNLESTGGPPSCVASTSISTEYEGICVQPTAGQQPWCIHITCVSDGTVYSYGGWELRVLGGAVGTPNIGAYVTGGNEKLFPTGATTATVQSCFPDPGATPYVGCGLDNLGSPQTNSCCYGDFAAPWVPDADYQIYTGLLSSGEVVLISYNALDGLPIATLPAILNNGTLWE